MTSVIVIIIAFCAIAIYIGVIRWVFRIDYIVLLLEINAGNTSGQFELIEVIKKQNNYSIE
jgi:hypothetical protein